jgi:hypothetical protein
MFNLIPSLEIFVCMELPLFSLRLWRLPPMMKMKLLTASMRKTKMMTTTSDLPFTELLLFPFWCLDAKGGEEYLNVFISSFLFGLGL